MGGYSGLPLETYIDEDTGDEVEYDDGDDRNCPFCKLEIISQSDLLTFALSRLKMTKKELEEEYRKEKLEETIYVCSCETQYDNEFEAMDCEEGHILDQCEHEKNAVYDMQGDSDYAEIVLVCKECCSAPHYVLKTWNLVDLLKSDDYNEEKLQTIAQLIGEGRTIEHC
jgi:hypothetical protein